MNNEEKILSMLESLTTTVSQIQVEQQKTNQRLTNLEQGQTDLKLEVNHLKQGQADLKIEVNHLKQEVNHLSIMTEDIQRNVEILAEGHTAVIEKLDKLPDIDVAKSDIEVIKSAVSDHSDKFNKLKAL